MERLPTLLIVVAPYSDSARSTLDAKVVPYDGQALSVLGLNSTLSLALRSGLPTAIVAPPEEAACARKIIPADSVIEIPLRELGAQNALSGQGNDHLISAVISGVLATPNAEGWIILPSTGYFVDLETILGIAHTLNSSVIASSQKMENPCFPIGFSSEMFSELIRMKSIFDLNKIISRYPSTSLKKLPRDASLHH